MKSAGVEGGDLAQRMDTGVGATGALEADFFAPEFFERDLDGFLHGAFVGLALPTGEFGAAIGDGEPVALE